jgi:hypothetical protein
MDRERKIEPRVFEMDDYLDSRDAGDGHLLQSGFRVLKIPCLVMLSGPLIGTRVE